jgi:hypothetical protein
MKKNVGKKFMNTIGANLDRLITIDWRGQGHIHPLYQTARDKSDGPLTMRAAQKFVDKIKERDVVFITAGFPVGPLDVLEGGRVVKEYTFSSNMLAPETDGVVAAALIARAVDLGFKGKPVVFCEDEGVHIIKGCCEAAGLRVFNDFRTSLLIPHTVTVLPFTKDPQKAPEEANKILDEMNPKAAISIERPGRNEKGFYHMANGRSITDFVARIDELFEGVGKRGGLTIGIGDLGNELGMGVLKEATKKTIFYGEKCRCGCGGGIGASSPAEATIFGAISEDAAYAFLACLAYLLSQPEILQSTEMETRILEVACNRGAIDGPSGLRNPWIDYLDVKIHNHQIELMREIIQSPGRFLKLQPFFYGDLNSK